MDIETYIFFNGVLFRDAMIRYRAIPNEATANQETINFIQVDFIAPGSEGARDIVVPTCKDSTLDSAFVTDLDRKVYQAMIDQGILDADITEVSIILCDHFVGGVPMVEFEGTFANIEGVVSGMINPFEPKDTPKMPILIWEAAAAKARDAVRRFTELTTVSE